MRRLGHALGAQRVPFDFSCPCGLHHRTGKREKHPIAQFTHVLMRQYVISFMRAGPWLTSFVVMAGFTVVVVVGASRNQVTELVHHLQPHNRRPHHQQGMCRKNGE